MKRTPSQNKALYGLFTKLSISEENKCELVRQFTNGRTAKSSEMLFNECNNLIKTLEEQYHTGKSQKSFESQYKTIEQRLRREIFKLFYDVGFIDNNMESERKVYILNGWIKKKMNLDKKLNDLSIEELERMRKQMLTVRRIYQEKSIVAAKFN